MQATFVQARPAAAVGGRRTVTRAALDNGARPVAALEAGSRIRVTAPVKVRGGRQGACWASCSPCRIRAPPAAAMVHNRQTLARAIMLGDPSASQQVTHP